MGFGRLYLLSLLFLVSACWGGDGFVTFRPNPGSVGDPPGGGAGGGSPGTLPPFERLNSVFIASAGVSESERFRAYGVISPAQTPEATGNNHRWSDPTIGDFGKVLVTP